MSQVPKAASRYQSAFRENLFKGQTIVVTGAGSGLGRCTAHELASLGANVAMVGRNLEKLQRVREEVTSQYEVTVSAHTADLRESDTVQVIVQDILAEHARIDGLFNCAGGQFPSPLDQLSPRGFDAVIRNNLHSTFLVSQAVYAQWMRQHGGTIVNMLADIWGGMPGMGHSGAARAGVWNLTETAACEWGHAGVRVNAVAPGWIASSGMDSYDEAYQAVLRNLPRHVPLQRFGTEAELSAAAVFLLSPASAFISGCVIRVDGGVPTARHSWNLAPASRQSVFQGFPLYEPPKAFT